MQDKNESQFTYTYSAKEREEIIKIREKYSSEKSTESKLELIFRLDRSVTKRGEIIALSLGIIGSLILGLGMSLIMSELSTLLGIAHPIDFILGIIFGALGLMCAAIAYPIYVFVTKKEHQRIAPEILKLTDELIK